MIRRYKEQYRKEMEKLDEYGMIEISYHGDVIQNEIYVCEDETQKDGERIVGYVYFKFHSTWYGENEKFHKIEPYYAAIDEKAEGQLITFSKEWFQKQKENYPNKRMAFVQWVEISQTEQIEKFCEAGFICYDVCPTLAFDLRNKVLPWELDKDFAVEELVFDPKQVDTYIHATKLANDGTADSLAELWFRTGIGIKVYQIKKEDIIVSAASTWHITETRAAIENIFSNPAYRNQGYAKTIIAYTLNKIREGGYETATLSCSGQNFKAQNLYQSLGFKQIDMQIEMIYF